MTTTESKKPDASDSLDLLVGNYHRPKTRGELRDKLKEGIECEVVATNAGITTSMLGWLDCYDFTVRLSENRGWAVFVPNALVDSDAAEQG